MFSFEYFFGFIAIGFVLRLFLEPVVSVFIIILITIGWGFVFGPWSILTFIELMIGWGLIQAASNAKEEKIDWYDFDE